MDPSDKFESEELNYPQSRKDLISSPIDFEKIIEKRKISLSSNNEAVSPKKQPNEKVSLSKSALNQETATKNIETTNLKQKELDDLYKDNLEYKEQGKKAMIQVDSLAQALSTKEKQFDDVYNKLNQTNIEAKKLEEELDEVIENNEALESNVDQLKREISKLKKVNEQLETEKNESESAIKRERRETIELQTALREITERYKHQMNDTESLILREQTVQDKIQELEVRMEETKYQESLHKSKAAKLVKDNEKLVDLSEGLQKAIDMLEYEASENYIQLQKVQQKCEELNSENERLLATQEQSKEEIKLLKMKLEQSYTKNKQRIETEGTLVRNQFIAEKKKLVNELCTSEDKRANLQSLMERAIREKRAAESELDKLYKNLPVETERFNNLLEELSTRLRISETEKMDAIRQLESYRNRKNREENKLEQEKQQNNSLSEELYRRVRRSERELEEAKDNQLHHLTKISELEQQIITLKQTQEKLQIQYAIESKATQDQITQNAHEFSARIDQQKQVNVYQGKQLQDLGTEYQNAKLKWKDEMHLFQTKYDAIIHQLHTDISRKNQQLQKMTETVSNLQEEKQCSERQINEYRINLTKLHQSASHYESRLEAVTKQLNLLLKKEQDLLSEKRRLERNLEKLSAEKEKNLFSAYLRHRSNDDDDDNIGALRLRGELDRIKERTMDISILSET